MTDEKYELIRGDTDNFYSRVFKLYCGYNKKFQKSLKIKRDGIHKEDFKFDRYYYNKTRLFEGELLDLGREEY